MKIENIYIGDIKKCTKYEEHNMIISNFGGIVTGFGGINTEGELYKKDVVLIKLKNGGYVDIDRYNTIFDKLKLTMNGNRLGELVMSRFASHEGSLYVDNLEPYYSDKPQINKSLVKQIKRNRKTTK